MKDMSEMKFCQSCGMPLSDEVLGTEKGNSKSADYCIYCYKDGGFTAECTMDEMIDFCVPHMVEGNPGMSEDAARSQMKEFFPKMKRWAK